MDRMPATLRELADRLAAAEDLRAGTEELAWACDGVVPFYRLSLVLPDATPDRWYVAASWARRPEEELAGYVFSLGGHPLQAVVELGETVIRTDPGGDAPAHPVSRLFQGEGKAWELAVPLPLAGRRGMLVLASRDRADPSPEAVGWIEDVARIAAVWARPWVGPDGPEILRSQYETLLEGALDGIAVVRDGQIVYANASFCELFGVTAEEALARPFERFLDHGSRPVFQGALAELEGRDRILPRIEVQGRGERGRRFPLDLGLQRILFGGLPSVLVQVHNAAARAERECAARARFEEVDELIQTLAHDIRTPLTTVMGFAELLLQRLPDVEPDRAREMLGLVLRSAGAVRMLAEELLEYAALGRTSAPMVRVYLEPLLRAVETEFEDLVRSSGARISYHRLPPEVWGRPVEIGRVFRNLMENALRYRRPEVPAEVTVSCTGEEGQFYVLCVEDNGRGIDPDHQARVFDLFSRGPGGGAGVGLAIVARIVAAHGGRAWVESEPGRGSRFYVTLPRPPEPSP